MKRISYQILNLLCVLPLCWLAACSSDTDGLQEEYMSRNLLQLMVSTGNMEGEQGTVTDEEQAIHSIYVYAYDDAYESKLPDFYKDENVDNPDGGTYAFQMKVYDKGEKRFYVFVNPPEYVRQELVYNADESKLKSLDIFQREPLKNIADLQQTIDGKVVNNKIGKHNGKVGLPMTNFFKAIVDFEPNNPRQLWLYPIKEQTHKIDGSIPLFRSMGKITIQACMKKEVASVGKGNVTISQINIFNYTTNGSCLPMWKINENDCFWKDSNWNPDLKMDLEKMVLKENAVQVQPVPLLEKSIEVGATNVDLISFYLCQNSYGPDSKIEGNWNGLVDTDGNRITKLSVTLDDGRKTEVPLPFLCRNDHLTVKLTITLHGILVTFEKWKELIVHPDWSDDVVPAPQTPTN